MLPCVCCDFVVKACLQLPPGEKDITTKCDDIPLVSLCPERTTLLLAQAPLPALT
jgi:hypothetical protein